MKPDTEDGLEYVGQYKASEAIIGVTNLLAREYSIVLGLVEALLGEDIRQAGHSLGLVDLAAWHTADS